MKHPKKPASNKGLSYVELGGPPMGLMRIFLACADERLRLALLLLLDHQPGMAVVGLSDRLLGLFNQVEGAQPDVLLLDWDLSDHTMADFFANIRILERRPQVIVLSIIPQDNEAIRSIGADFIFCKNAPPDELIPVLNEISLSGTKQSKADG
jgi:DNA-binding NarL/FixJ family response regulator